MLSVDDLEQALELTDNDEIKEEKKILESIVRFGDETAKEEKQLGNIKENLDVLTIAANGSSPITMDDPDVQGADMLIAVTGSDFGCGNCFFWIIGMNRKRNFLLF